LWFPDCTCCQDKVNWAVGRLRHLADGAVFFARHFDYFIVTQNPHPSIGTWYHLDNFIMTPNPRPLTGTGKKSRTAIRRLAERQRTRKSLAADIATPNAAAKNMFFCLSRIHW